MPSSKRQSSDCCKAVRANRIARWSAVAAAAPGGRFWPKDDVRLFDAIGTNVRFRPTAAIAGAWTLASGMICGGEVAPGARPKGDRMSLIAELRRRKVFKAGAAYLVVAWLAVQVASIGLPAFDAPAWALRVFILLALLGFPVCVVLAWVLDFTPEGMRWDPDVSGSKRVYAAAAILVALAVGWYFYGQPSFRKGDPATPVANPPAIAVDPHSIAVLPFDNRSGDAGQNYYADGLTDELTTTLARISALKVIARTSATRFKGSSEAPSAIGHQLGVANLVTGSVLRAEGRIRYTAELVTAADERTLWADSFERDESDVLTLQSQVAQAIAKAIAIRLSPTEATRLASSRTVDPRAFDEYIRGRALWNQRDEASVREALLHFQKATVLSPDFALGYAGIADCNIILGVWGFEPPRTVMPLAKAAAQHAIELDPSAGEPHASLGDIHFHYDWDNAASSREHTAAIDLAPGFATAYQWASEPLEAKGDYAGAIASLRHAQALDPLSMIVRAQLARVMARSGEREDALRVLRDAVAMDPRFLRTRRELVAQLLAAGHNPEALEQARALVALAPQDVASLAQLGLSLGRNGQATEAKALLARLDAESAKRFVSSLERARISAGLGDRAATLGYLEAAVAEREGNVPLLPANEEFDFLRDDSRYAALHRTVEASTP